MIIAGGGCFADFTGHVPSSAALRPQVMELRPMGQTFGFLLPWSAMPVSRLLAFTGRQPLGTLLTFEEALIGSRVLPFVLKQYSSHHGRSRGNCGPRLLAQATRLANVVRPGR